MIVDGKELDVWCYDNWLLISEEFRRNCLDALWEQVPADVISEWSRQTVIGENDNFFHFGAGMGCRNILRTALSDDWLPYIKYEDGTEVQNWDDFYTGALVDFLKEIKAAYSV